MTFRFALLLCLWSLLQEPVQAQELDTLWTRIDFPGPENSALSSIVPLADGSFLVGGAAGSPDPVVYIRRIDAHGDSIWTRFPADSLKSFRRMAKVDDSTVVFATRTRPYLNPAIGKLRSSGEVVWIRSYPRSADADWITGLAIAPDGGCVVAAWGFSPDSAIAVWKVDAAGDLDWATRVGVPGYAAFLVGDLIRDQQGGYTLLTQEQRPDWSWRLGLVRLSDQGQITARYAVDSTQVYQDLEVWRLRQTPDGDYLLLSNWQSAPQSANFDIVLQKVTATGQSVWHRRFGNGYSESAYDLDLLPDGDILLCGIGRPATGGYGDALFLRVSASGDSLWTAYFGWDFSDFALTLVALSPTDFIAGGERRQYDGHEYAQDWVARFHLPDAALTPRPVMPSTFSLAQNIPNPFNATTQLRFTLPYETHVSLRIFDITGREVRVLVDARASAGEHAFLFDAGDLPSGLYFARLDAAGQRQTRKIVLLK